MICENCKCTLSKPSKTSLQTGVCNQCRVQLKTENEDSEIVKEEQFCESCRQDDSRIKDLRTGIENRNTQAVLDGDLDRFIEASLKAGL